MFSHKLAEGNAKEEGTFHAIQNREYLKVAYYLFKHRMVMLRWLTYRVLRKKDPIQFRLRIRI